jgi:small subunit ribosomal protein S13
MVRISGVDLPRNKRIEIGLTYIFGIGITSAKEILSNTNVSPDTRCIDLTDEEVNSLRTVIDGQYQTEGDLRRVYSLNIKRLTEIGSAADCAANGVLFFAPLKPLPPDEAQKSVLPCRSVILTIVLLNVDFTCDTPITGIFFDFFENRFTCLTIKNKIELYMIVYLNTKLNELFSLLPQF